MKILFVHERMGAFGGAEANILLTARELKRRTHQLALFHGPPTGRAEAEWNAAFPSRFPFAPKNAPQTLETALREFQPDLVYVHKMADLKVLAALATGTTPVVRMVHDHDLYCMRSYRYSPFNRQICTRPASLYCVFPCGAFLSRNRNGPLPVRWVSYTDKKKEIRLNKAFARLLVASRYMKEELLTNGFDEDRISICAPVPNSLRTGPPSSYSPDNIIIYAGQVIRGKGVDVLLESLVQVEVPFQCLIIGDGNHLRYCQALSRKLNLSDRVQFKGFLPQDKLSDYYRHATVAAVSSVWPEPFGAVGLEAMSYGLPVVAFDVGGIREWLISAYNGFLVPCFDREGYAARVQQLLNNKELARQMGERGQRLIQQKFAFASYISALENVFDSVRAENRLRMAA